MAQRKKIVFDMFLNIIAASLPVAVLQLVVYPLTAKAMGGDEYGLMLTIYSIWIMVSNSLGNVLNNVRLLRNNEYEERGINGDFNVLLLRWNAVNAVAIGAIILFYCGSFHAGHIVLGIVVAALVAGKAYWEVGFRLILNYKAIVANNTLQSMGFLLGGYLAVKTGAWELIFLLGYAFSCVFCLAKTKLYKEPRKKTELFSAVNKDANRLVLATIISNMMNYADKLVLYPLMGGTTVSIYYTATILGKIVGMLTGPINSVILSYISRWKENKKGILNAILVFGTGLCTIGYVAVIFLAKPVLGLLFPQWLGEVMHYIPVTTINVLLLTMISIISPFVLKFCDMKWQIIINAVSLTVYFGGAFALWHFFGLMGFCVGTILGTATKLGIMLFVYYGQDKS